jgi:hypothetical protein
LPDAVVLYPSAKAATPILVLVATVLTDPGDSPFKILLLGKNFSSIL